MFEGTRPQATSLQERRRRLSAALNGEQILLIGHRGTARNFLANTHPFRQDSTFLFFLGVDRPGAAAVIDVDGRTCLYLPEIEPGDAMWHGPTPPPEVWMERSGVAEVRPWSELEPGDFHVLPSVEAEANNQAGRLSGLKLDPRQPGTSGSTRLRDAVIALRMTRDTDELAAMSRAIEVTDLAHRAAMAATAPGVSDQELHALIDSIFSLHGMVPAYGSIVTARGEVLHGRAQGEVLEEGQLLLVDAGAEEPFGYASDVTRTWPVSGRFSSRQKEVYQAVLESQLRAIERYVPGQRFRDIHLVAASVLVDALKAWGLLRGDRDGLLEQGAHAPFFPHGLGHLIGLDVHDMELLGDQVGYGPGHQRSDQFGLSFLRLDRRLEPGMVITAEPGLYFSPSILSDRDLRERLGDAVDWDLAESWLSFGGIRIEDDVLVTSGEPVVLSASVPKSVEAIEALVGSGPSPRDRLLGQP